MWSSYISKFQYVPKSLLVLSAMKWPVISSAPPGGVSKVATNQLKTQQKEDAKLLKSLTFDQIEIEFRKRVSIGK